MHWWKQNLKTTQKKKSNIGSLACKGTQVPLSPFATEPKSTRNTHVCCGWGWQTDWWHKIQLQKRMSNHNCSRRKASSFLKGCSALSSLPNKGKLIYKRVLPLGYFYGKWMLLSKCHHSWDSNKLHQKRHVQPIIMYQNSLKGVTPVTPQAESGFGSFFHLVRSLLQGDFYRII